MRRNCHRHPASGTELSQGRQPYHALPGDPRHVSGVDPSEDERCPQFWPQGQRELFEEKDR